MKRALMVLLLLLSSSAAAASPVKGPLVGEPAPPLQIGRWLKGQPVTRWERGKVYVIDIWAPWCGPCLGGMQHLTDLQKKNAARGLVVVGMTGPDDYGSTLQEAQRVLAVKGAAIGYAIAWDEGRRTYRAWMAREEHEGWPWSFIIGRDGRIAYIGHPGKLDQVLEQVLAGTYDMNAAARRYRARASALDFLPQFVDAYRNQRWDEAITKYETLLGMDAGVAASMVGAAYKVVAIGLADEKRAAAFGRELVRKQYRDNADALGTLALTIIDPDVVVPRRDFDLALLAANRANEILDQKNTRVLQLLARVHFAAGDVQKAVAIQEKVVALSPPADQEEARRVLSSFIGAGGTQRPPS